MTTRNTNRRTPRLILHHGDAQAELATHPTELARKALIAAAAVETGVLADHLTRFAATLPVRGPIRHKAR